MSLDNQPSITRPTLIYLYPDGLRYYLFVVILDKCGASCNVTDDPSSRIHASNKTEDVNLKVINMVTVTNESKIPLQHVSCN